MISYTNSVPNSRRSILSIYDDDSEEKSIVTFGDVQRALHDVIQLSKGQKKQKIRGQAVIDKLGLKFQRQEDRQKASKNISNIVSVNF